MIRFLQKSSNWKFISPLFILFAFFTFYLFPEYQGRLDKSAGEKVQSLDTRFSYTLNDVNTFFEKLGSEGRDIYSFVVGKIDMIYPVIYGLLFILLLAFLLKKVFPYKKKLILMALLPVLGMLFDYLENFNTLKLLEKYPFLTEKEPAFGELMTRCKHSFLFLSVLLAVILFLIWLNTLVRKKLR